MLRKQRIVYGKSGTVYFDVPEGRASAATVTVKNNKGNDLPDSAVEDENATIDSVSTTVAAGWSASTPRTIPLTSVANVAVGRDYLITTGEGREEWVSVVGIDTDAKTITVLSTPGFSLTAADTFVGTRLTYIITAANAETRAHNYRCLWTYTVGGEVFTGENLFDIVRTVPKSPATNTGLRKYSPELMSQWEQLLDDNYDLQDRIDDAFDRVMIDLESRSPSNNGWADAIVQWSQCERTVYEHVLLEMALAGYSPPAYSEQIGEWVDRREIEYKRAVEEWTGKIIWYDAGDDRRQGVGEEGRNLWSINLVK